MILRRMIHLVSTVMAFSVLLLSEQSAAELNFTSDKLVEKQKRDLYNNGINLPSGISSLQKLDEFIQHCSAMSTSSSADKMVRGISCDSPELHIGIDFNLNHVRLLILKQNYEKCLTDYKLTEALVKLGEESKETLSKKGIMVREAEKELQIELDRFNYYE